MAQHKHLKQSCCNLRQMQASCDKVWNPLEPEAGDRPEFFGIGGLYG